MGTLHYDTAVVELDDRVLTHLQIVIVQKFRRGESFLMSWLQQGGGTAGRGSLWLSPNAPLAFKFVGSRVPSVDEAWLQRLARSADSSTGLILTGEDGRPTWITPVRQARPAVRGTP